MLKSDLNLSNFESFTDVLLKKEMVHKSINCCPFCKGKNYIKYGKYAGIQRFKCKKCKRTFSLVTNTLWAYSKKTYKTWIEFIELLVEKQTLRYCASKLKINLVTAFYWRQKVLDALNSTEKLKILKGNIHIGKTSVKENFKGCRNILTSERKNVIVFGGIDSKDTMISEVISKGVWSYQAFNEKVYKKIKKGAYIISYGDRYLLKIARDNNKKKIKKCAEEPRMRYFNRYVHLWLLSFRGVATKYLNKYLSWFILNTLNTQIGWIELVEFIGDLCTYKKIKDIGKNFF